MKPWITAAVALAIACTIAFRVISAHLELRDAEAAATREAAWQKKYADLAAVLKKAKQAPPPAAVSPAIPVRTGTPSAPELIAKLQGLKSGGASQARLSREAIHLFEQLIALGPAALPAIREFLARDVETDFAFAGTGQGKGSGKLPDEFMVPPSLRFGLFDAIRQIGGAEAEKLLAEILGTTGRGVELAWIARALQQSAPNKYRDVAVAGARELLDRPLAAAAGSPLDRNDRDHLFSVLAMYGDTGYLTSAQSQLVQADGVIDHGALRYLQQSLGPQSVPIAAQVWNDPRLTDTAKKEPLARLALTFAGTDQQANEFYVAAINDMGLTKDQRSNLIEDLNEDGLTNRKNLTAADLPLIENRIALIEQLAPSAADEVNAAAFKEAHKDLVNMRARITNPPVLK